MKTESMIAREDIEQAWHALATGESMRLEWPVEQGDLLLWLAAQTTNAKMYYSSSDGKLSVTGIGSLVTLSLDDVDEWQKKHDLAIYGGLSFDASFLSQEWDSFGSSQFILPAIEYYHKEGQYFMAVNLLKNSDANMTLKYFDQLVCSPKDFSLPSYQARSDQPSQEQWLDIIDGVLKDIDQDMLQKVVLARRITFVYDNDIDACCVLHALEQLAPNANRFLFQFSQGKTFFGASPEVLYERQGNSIHSIALAGTLPRGKTQEQDEAFKKELVASEKLRDEHNCVVNKLQERLERLCDFVLKEDQAIMSLGYGHHLATPFKGTLKSGFSDQKCVLGLHPTPAVAGLPTDAALIGIKDMEGFSRGWFAGAIARIKRGDVRFIVAIRSALVDGNNMHVYAGAGIVKGSNPQDEWDEIDHKITNLLKVVQG